MPDERWFGLHPRTATRLLVIGVVFLGLLLQFRDPLATLSALLLDGVSGRELTLALLALLSTLVPLLVATALADALYDRFR
jgi:predicted RND superfamily exporter protein